MQEIYNTDTHKFETLICVDPKTGFHCDHELTDGYHISHGFIECDQSGHIHADNDCITWWREFFYQFEVVEEKLREMRQEYGVDVVDAWQWQIVDGVEFGDIYKVLLNELPDFERRLKIKSEEEKNNES